MTYNKENAKDYKMTVETAHRIAEDIVSQMTIEEKASQLLYNSPAIPRLGIHEYNWWNEASHGVARSGMATVFPHAIALAATFDPELVGQVGDAVSTEGRAKYNSSVAHGDFDIYKGLTYWTPNINIFRDPRWGRGQETFGEDPYLTATLGVRYINGLQGEGAWRDGRFLKAAACAKHFAVHSGPEPLRHEFNAEVNDHDLWETYLPAFEYAVNAGVAGVMGAYNRTNGEPCCASNTLIGGILRGKWGFEGYFTSDCGAINDIHAYHRYTSTIEEACAISLKAGCELNCGSAYSHLMEAYEEDLIIEDDITEAAVSLYTIRAMLGEFEENRPFADIPFDKLDCAEHRELNLKAAHEAIVLLQNDGFLPIAPSDNKKIAVIGPNAMSQIALEGNYNGMASEYITVAEGMRRVFGRDNIRAAKGSNIWLDNRNDCTGFTNMISEGISYAENADITVLCLGLDCTIEGEETGMKNEYFDNGDRVSLGLPKTQMELARAVCDVCSDVIVVLMGGSAIDLGDELRGRVHAVIDAWYPGAVGGLAIAEIIAGLYSPCGRLPITFYSSDNTIPAFTDYSMEGRTYRYLREKPLYPFGYGLSYTTFAYRDAAVSKNDGGYKITFSVKNTGSMSGTEKTQVYARFTDSRTVTPNFQLCGVGAIFLEPGEEKTVSIDVDGYFVSAVLDNGERTEPDGEIAFYLGGHQPDERSCELYNDECIKIDLLR